MLTLDRSLIPAFRAVEKIDLVKAGEKYLANRIPVYSINAGTQSLIRIEFVFEAGMYQQKLPLQAASVNSMLEEGTSHMNAAQIADAVDYYGAFLEVNIAQDTASVVLYTLNKHLAETLPVVEQVIKDATFPQRELDTHLQNKKQKLLVNNQKVANLARKRFSELIFGAQHPYGRDVREKDFDNINRDLLNDFYRKYYRSDNCRIVIAGRVTDEVHSLLDKYFGGSDWSGSASAVAVHTIEPDTTKEREHLLFREDALQSAIRVGKIMFNKTHADFHPMQVLNVVLGGYFGSRLMSNIREDKGYTYGIGSGMVSLQHSGYFFISTEVGVDVCGNALKEIYFEIDRLREELITEEELDLVRSYMLGTFLRSVDGPFAMADRFRGIMEYNLGYDYFDHYIATIKSVSASQLRDLANKYFERDSLVELVVGKK